MVTRANGEERPSLGASGRASEDVVRLRTLRRARPSQLPPLGDAVVDDPCHIQNFSDTGVTR